MEKLQGLLSKVTSQEVTLIPKDTKLVVSMKGNIDILWPIHTFLGVSLDVPGEIFIHTSDVNVCTNILQEGDWNKEQANLFKYLYVKAMIEKHTVIYSIIFRGGVARFHDTENELETLLPKSLIPKVKDELTVEEIERIYDHFSNIFPEEDLCETLKIYRVEYIFNNMFDGLKYVRYFGMGVVLKNVSPDEEKQHVEAFSDMMRYYGLEDIKHRNIGCNGEVELNICREDCIRIYDAMKLGHNK